MINQVIPHFVDLNTTRTVISLLLSYEDEYDGIGTNLSRTERTPGRDLQLDIAALYKTALHDISKLTLHISC
jgi:hypothetical protein